MPSASPDPTTVLPPNRGTAVVVAVAALVGWIPLAGVGYQLFSRSPSLTWGFALLLTLLLVAMFVVAPLVAIRAILTRRVSVTPDEVVTTRGGHVEARMPLAAVTRIHPLAGTSGLLRSSQRAVTLEGRGPDGTPSNLHVSRTLVATLAPLLDRLSAEIARRPGLLADEEDQETYAALVELEG
jgi:hypothetical protein